MKKASSFTSEMIAAEFRDAERIVSRARLEHVVSAIDAREEISKVAVCVKWAMLTARPSAPN